MESFLSTNSTNMPLQCNTLLRSFMVYSRYLMRIRLNSKIPSERVGVGGVYFDAGGVGNVAGGVVEP